MKQQSQVLRSLSACLLGLLFLASCKKVNEATELGGDLIPPVDNVNTFDTTLEVLTYNYPFESGDSARSITSETHFIGNISNDPLFGKSSGTLFLQLKPAVSKTPFAFTDKAKLVALDSAVLVLGYRSLYGDSTQPVSFQVFEIDQASNFRRDSAYFIHQNNFAYGNAISGINTVLPSALNDSLRMFRELAANQLRLKLDNAFGMRLLQYDSTNAYLSDSAFSTYFKGFAVKPQNKSLGNALIGVAPSDTNTKVAVYYRYTNAAGALDTAVTYFRFNTTSAAANYIERDRSGSDFAAVGGDSNPDDLVYIQNSPGTYARLVVPGLQGLTNRVVHRAEIVVQQVPDPLSNIFTPPTYLYLDAFDTADKVYRTIPIDAAISPTNGQVTNTAQFGMTPRQTTAPGGIAALEWRFDISRYVQRVANGTLKPYEFRLSSPFLIRSNIGAGTTSQILMINPQFAVGRVRVGGGSHSTQAMKLRIVYSKL